MALPPEPLRGLRGWLLWRSEPQAKGKPRKVPYYVGGGRRLGVQGSPEDRKRLVTYDEAVSALSRADTMSGLGLALLPEWGVTALDFDDAVTDGIVDPRIESLVADTYAERSPSGKGVRAFYLGDLGDRKQKAEPGVYGYETFSHKGYVTVTGNVLPVNEALGTYTEIAPLTLEVRAHHLKFFPPVEYTPPDEDAFDSDESEIAALLRKLPNDLQYDDWVKVGMAVHHATGGAGFEIWESWSATSPKWGGHEYDEERWRSFGKNTGTPVTLASVAHIARKLDVATADDFADIVEAEAEKPKQGRFPFMQAAKFVDRPPPKWLIKHVLPEAELIVLYGASGSGKSFGALDMACAIARGLPWRGRKVVQGGVFYIAAEGAGGFRNRLLAYGLHNDLFLQDLPLTVMPAAPNFLERDHAIDVAGAVNASGGARLIIVDTFAQVTPGGNENSGEDVGLVLKHCKGIHKATGATVMLIHHSGKDATKGARGWSGLRAAADAELEVTKFPGGGRLLKLTKSKDGVDDLEWGFGLEVVPVGMDEDMEQITSCVVVDAPVPHTGGVASRVLGRVERLVNEVVQEFALAQSEGIEIDEVVKEAASRLDPPEAGKRDTRKQQVKKAVKNLCAGDDALYFEEDGCLSIL